MIKYLLTFLFILINTPAFSEPSHNRTELVGPENPELKWSFQTNGSLHASPLIADDGTVYVASTDGFLYALSSEGNLLWKFDAGESIFGTPALTPEGDIVIGDLDGKVQCVKPDGLLNWIYSIEDGSDRRILGGPVVSDEGDVFVSSWNNQLYSINQFGTKKWSARLDGLVSNNLTVNEDGDIYVAYNENGELAVKKFLGSRSTARWTASINMQNKRARVSSSPAYDETLDVLVVGACRNNDGIVFAVDESTGRELWNQILPKGVTAKPAITANGNVVVSCLDGYVYSLDGDDGSIEWNFAVDGYFVMGSPMIDGNGIIYVGDSDGTLYALSPNGELIWQYESDSNIRSAPMVAEDGTLYFTSYDSTVYALNEPTAIRAWLDHQ